MQGLGLRHLALPLLVLAATTAPSLPGPAPAGAPHGEPWASPLPAAAPGPSGGPCVECHARNNPGIVAEWRASAHAREGIVCSACHGEGHLTESDASKAAIPTPETCGACHETQVTMFKRGKHAAAWAAMKAMPTIHWQPMEMTEGMKGCGGCHKIGLKDSAEIRRMREEGAGFGVASCDACHTRHLFSADEARQPEACRTCHMGSDHPQWEMYDGSKHGVRNRLVRDGILPEGAQAPSCRTCHMPDGNHEVRTAWGFLGVRLPMPEDAEWAADGAEVLEALGFLDASGRPSQRFETVKGADVVRQTQEEWQIEREKSLETCARCHSRNYAAEELRKGDRMIREADRLMAEAIRIVSALYDEGHLARPSGYEGPLPDLLAFHDAPTGIEQRLFVMFFEHRMRAFQGTFHANPDYALWRGWSEMKRDLTEIQERARDIRARHAAAGSAP